MPGPQSGNGQCGAGRALRGPVWGLAFLGRPQRLGGGSRCRSGPHSGPQPDLTRTRAPSSRSSSPPAAGRRARAHRSDSARPSLRARLLPRGAWGRGGGGARAAGGAGTGALRRRLLACHLATGVVVAKNRDAGLSCPRGRGICAAARRCADSTSCRCRDGGEGLILIVHVDRILPQLFSVRLVFTVGKYKEKQNLLSATSLPPPPNSLPE